MDLKRYSVPLKDSRERGIERGEERERDGGKEVVRVKEIECEGD